MQHNSIVNKKVYNVFRRVVSKLLFIVAGLIPVSTLVKSLKKRTQAKNPRDAKAWQIISTAADELGGWGYLSFSQTGEDAVLRNFLRNRKSGIYVDVGANHPIRYSNTYYWYLRGWRGINIEPMIGSKALFDKYRPQDINLEIAVGKRGTSTLFVFKETCFNTMDACLAEKLIKDNISPLIEKRSVDKIPLKEILASHLGEDSIDFLSVDAEGLDTEILASNDWDRFRPCYVIAERHMNDPFRPTDPGIILGSYGYVLVAQTEFSCLYRDNC